MSKIVKGGEEAYCLLNRPGIKIRLLSLSCADMFIDNRFNVIGCIFISRIKGENIYYFKDSEEDGYWFLTKFTGFSCEILDDGNGVSERVKDSDEPRRPNLGEENLNIPSHG